MAFLEVKCGRYSTHLQVVRPRAAPRAPPVSLAPLSGRPCRESRATDRGADVEQVIARVIGERCVPERPISGMSAHRRAGVLLAASSSVGWRMGLVYGRSDIAVAVRHVTVSVSHRW